MNKYKTYRRRKAQARQFFVRFVIHSLHYSNICINEFTPDKI